MKKTTAKEILNNTKLFTVAYETEDGRWYDVQVPGRTEEEAGAFFARWAQNIKSPGVYFRSICPAPDEISTDELIRYIPYLCLGYTYDEYLIYEEQAKTARKAG